MVYRFKLQFVNFGPDMVFSFSRQSMSTIIRVCQKAVVITFRIDGKVFAFLLELIRLLLSIASTAFLFQGCNDESNSHLQLSIDAGLITSNLFQKIFANVNWFQLQSLQSLWTNLVGHLIQFDKLFRYYCYVLLLLA